MLRTRPEKSHQTPALIAGIAAFTTWGLIPVYWKLLKDIRASEILAHRFDVFLIGLLSWRRRWPEVKKTLQSRCATLYCLSSGAAVALNWFFFIYAVNIGRIIETSYFMTPLINVVLGAAVLRERLTHLQMVSVTLAAIAVLYLTFGYGHFPWIALALCTTFGLYGLLRKKSGTAAIPGLSLETALLVPVAIGYLFLLKANDTLIFSRGGWLLSILLMSTRIVTAVPLFWFGFAAPHLRLTTIGFLQYLSPTGSFFLGVFLYHEPFSRGHLITFILIWVALVVFTAEAVMRWRSARVREVAAGAFAASALD
jgi:chloramphenicol-sensitive protein RarD